MIYKVTVKPEIARTIEANSAAKGLTPEQFLVETIECVVRQHGASEAEIPRLEERARARQGKIDEGNNLLRETAIE